MIAETHHIEAELRFDGSDGTPHYLFERVLAWDTEGRAHVPCSDTGRLVPLDRVAGIETSGVIEWTRNNPAAQGGRPAEDVELSREMHTQCVHLT